MSVITIDPLPTDVQEILTHLADSAGLTPLEVIREALDLYAHELEDRRAAERAERMTPRTNELHAILERNPRPSTWHDSDEALF